jgi:biopolymer transport protein ExbD
VQIPNQQNRPFVGANMTPMIDVVFLLIIFFLVSSHLARQESRLPVELPVAESHDPLSVEPVSLTITVNRDQQVLVGGEAVDSARLGAILDDVFAQEGTAASIRIRTDAAVPYRVIEPILKAAARRELLDLKLAVKE